MEDYLRSPFHQNSPKILDFWELLKPWFPNHEENQSGREEALDKQRLFALLFPDTPYRDSNISNLMSTLSRLLEEFWVQLSLRNHDSLRQRLVLQAYRERQGLEADYQRLWTSLEKRQQESGNLSPEELFLLLSIREEYLSYQSEHQPRNAALALEESLEVVTDLTLLLNLKYFLAALNRARLVGESPQLQLQQAIWQYLDTHPVAAAKRPLRAFAGVIRCLLHPEDQTHYPLAKVAFTEDLPLLADNEAKTLAYTLLNYLNGRLKSEGQAVLPELFDLYRTSYDHGLLFAGEYLDTNVYLNILNVVTGVIKQHSPDEKLLRKWRSNFVQENYLRLRPSPREEVFTYAKAYLAHQEGEFRQAYQLLSQYKPADILADLSRRSLLIRVYFDAWDDDLFDSQVKSALMYISRATAVSASKRQAYNRFVKLTRQLSGLRGKPIDPKKLDAIEAQIRDPEPLECRQWLTEKVLQWKEPDR